MTKKRIALTVALVVIVLIAAGGYAIWNIVAPPDVSSFYDTPDNLGDGSPGDIIRDEEIDSKVDNARLWRIVYQSTDADGNAVAVSALIAAPTAAAPEGGYPLVAIGHGTAGINRGCGPSVDPFDSFNGGATNYDFFVTKFVEAGHAVVMADYQGLGVRGDSSYLVGEIEGRNILDSARAALSFSELTLQEDIVIWGQSQGGHAALWAGQLAPTYAPELKILGVAAESPAADLQAIFESLIQLNAQGGVVALPLMAADAWIKAYPELDIDQIMTKRGKGALNNVIEPVCLMPAILATQLAQPSDLVQPGALEVLLPAVVANTPSTGTYAMPLFIGQGDADHVVPVSTSTHFSEELCASNNQLTYKIYEGVDHFSIIDVAAPDVLAWMQSLRDGVVPATTCAA